MANVPDDAPHIATVIAAFLVDCFDDKSVEVKKITLREIEVRRATNSGPRYFTIKVSERV